MSTEAKDRFGEPAKFLPVAFILLNIAGLYWVYVWYHAIPLLHSPSTYTSGIVQTILINCITVMLLICYVRCILTHPGAIPENDGRSSQWDYVPQDPRHDATAASGIIFQEKKRGGDPRHCKWCAKYKPDRCHHCRVCRMCILKMDHHCPWIYNCVGFANHKFFFLLLSYSVVATNVIFWTMLPSVRDCVDDGTPFVKMFSLLFGETLAAFLGVLVTIFWMFHIWLMLKAMTTIEFCEKSMKRTGYDSSVYDIGHYGNIVAVLGDQPLLWFLPCNPPSGDGMAFINEKTPLASKDVQDARGWRREVHETSPPSKKKKKDMGTAGTGELGASDDLSGGESGPESDRSFEFRNPPPPFSGGLPPAASMLHNTL